MNLVFLVSIINDITASNEKRAWVFIKGGQCGDIYNLFLQCGLRREYAFRHSPPLKGGFLEAIYSLCPGCIEVLSNSLAHQRIFIEFPGTISIIYL